MRDIDEMDMLGYLRIRAWNANRKKKDTTPKHHFIDEVWPSVKP